VDQARPHLEQLPLEDLAHFEILHNLRAAMVVMVMVVEEDVQEMMMIARMMMYRKTSLLVVRGVDCR